MHNLPLGLMQLVVDVEVMRRNNLWLSQIDCESLGNRNLLCNPKNYLCTMNVVKESEWERRDALLRKINILPLKSLTYQPLFACNNIQKAIRKGKREGKPMMNGRI